MPGHQALPVVNACEGGLGEGDDGAGPRRPGAGSQARAAVGELPSPLRKG